jgi:ketosteroid isomerase-like protein
MHPHIINGSESTRKLDAPLVALSQFYQAFNKRDADASVRNWAESGDVSMDNPLGGIRRGWNKILEGYQRIMHGPARVYVEFYDFTVHKSGTLCFFVGRERGHFEHAGKTLELHIRTSRIYQLNCGQWKQVHHHGSIDDPELLAQYQAAVKNI